MTRLITRYKKKCYSVDILHAWLLTQLLLIILLPFLIARRLIGPQTNVRHPPKSVWDDWRLFVVFLVFWLQIAIESFTITKTRLYNFDPLEPHFYIVKLGFTGVYIIFLISAQNTDCGYSLEPPRRGGSNEYLQSMFWAEIWKNIRDFWLKIFSFWRWNFLYIWIGVFS